MRILEEQKRYYRERAGEYDDWWFRRGRYALEPEWQARWDADVAEVEDALAAFGATGDVLELAAGTGLWTRHLARTASRLVALDSSPETLELNRARVEGSVEHVVADLWEWQPEERFDVCFFAFWHSHVPEERFEDFWSLVRGSLRPGGRVFLVDSGGRNPLKPEASTTGEEERTLDDGRSFRIVKRYWEPAALRERLRGLGFDLDLRRTANGTFVYGGGR